MQAIIISDTSCLILLEKIDELLLLEKLFSKIFVTQLVADEFGKPLSPWVIIQNPGNTTNQILLEASLDKGEASAIALAMEMTDCLLIIDELKGRRLAQQLGIKIAGTLAIIVEAKKRGHIASIQPILQKIKNTNFRLTQSLEEVLLNDAGE